MRYESTPSYNELDSRVRRGLGFRGMLAGRKRLMRLAVEEYRHGIGHSEWQEAVERRIRQDYSNPILIMILIPLVTELIKIFLIWLVERRSNAILASSWALESHDA